MKSARHQEKSDNALILSSYDGIRRSKQLEDTITEAVFHAFGTAPGRDALAYLRTITLNRVTPEGASDAQLRELEGQRRLVAGLIARIDDEDRRKRAATTKEK